MAFIFDLYHEETVQNISEYVPYSIENLRDTVASEFSDITRRESLTNTCQHASTLYPKRSWIYDMNRDDWFKQIQI